MMRVIVCDVVSFPVVLERALVFRSLLFDCVLPAEVLAALSNDLAFVLYYLDYE